MSACRRLTLSVVLLSMSLGSAAIAAAERDRVITGVQDLAYGEVLFHYFQDDYFSALTRLLAAQSRRELTHHASEAELLLGGLYLSYGQHRLAGEIFERLLAESVDQEIHDRAWLFLAKIWYQRGYLSEANAALARIKGELDVELEPERQILTARILMDQGLFEEALAVLEAWRDPRAEWVGYAKYNVGVALVRLNRIAEGAAVLDEVGQLRPRTAELSGLRDKANVALGYAWLQADRPLDARAPLQRVRLDGPFSNKALLGVGWSDAASDRFESALVPWMELTDRNLLDPAVQEALLAVPYAFGRLGADEQAATHYLDAIGAFNDELQRVENSIASIGSGDFIATLLDNETVDASGWQWRLTDLPDSDETRFLYEELASHRFQEGLKNYRDLRFLRGNLEGWLGSLGAFDDILDTRQRAYDRRLPLINESLERMNVDEMSAELGELGDRLAVAEASRNVVAFGTADQQDQWRRLQEMEASLIAVAGEPQADEFQRKHRILEGVLLWELEREYKVRLWREQRNLAALENEIKAASATHRRVDDASTLWPQDFAELTGRVESLTPRVFGLVDQIDRTIERQAEYLQGIAVEELQARHDRLSTYRVQARFALASIYDRATAQLPPATVDEAPQERLAEVAQ